MSDILVNDFYTQNVRGEWRRLVKDAYHRIEFDTTLYFMERYLPAVGLVLDAGGGPGRYTIELAKRGYELVLFDATQANLDFAMHQVKRQHQQDRVREITQGSIVDLSRFPDATFDAVLCSGGPLSHILARDDRARAIRELFRVAKPGAPVFASVMGRLSVLVVILEISQDEIEMDHFDRLQKDGDYFGGHGFTACHFFLPDEFHDEFSIPGVEILEMVGLEGINSHHSRALNRLAKNTGRYQKWLETHLKTCTHPGVVAVSEHMLLVCRKKSGN